jgi:hypothetical protein|tara:strand:- start:52 stop:405 length:354 start_codon:yes stop_codon:yes gene_type:complete
MVKIFGLSKFEFHTFYELGKEQDFFSGFRKFLVNMEFGEENSNYEIYSFGRPDDKDHEPDTSKEENIKDYVDKHYFYQNDKYMIDLVFGKEKIFLMIASKKDKQQEISEKVQKFCSF